MTHQAIPVVEASQPSAARFAARQLGERIGFSEADSYRAGIVATELGTNLVKHARGGEILMRATADDVPELELMAIDRGPGMANVGESLADGHSTTGSSGTGLGAVRRLSDEFDIHSTVPRGTIVLARIRGARAAPQRRGEFTLAGVSVPKTGETECGDAWNIQHRPDSVVAVIADGLGHGHYAAEAAATAVETLRTGIYSDCASALSAMHEGLRHTRGAAVAVLELHRPLRLMKFAGVGNISAAVLTNGSIRQAMSHNGTLGHEARLFREYSYPWNDGALVVMHSDGLVSHWSLDSYSGLRTRHPAVIAGVLYRDFNRGRDDVTVVVGRETA